MHDKYKEIDEMSNGHYILNFFLKQKKQVLHI